MTEVIVNFAIRVSNFNFMSFISVASLLKNRIGGGHLSEKVTAALVCEEFDKLIFEIWGEIIKTSARAMYLKERVLTVACLSSVVAQEVKMKEQELLEKLNAKFPGKEKIVERIRILL